MSGDHYDVLVIGSGPGGATGPSGLILTIVANALRVGDHLAERIGATRRAQAGIVSSPSSPTQ